MRHRKSGVKLNRTSSHRKAMFRNMVTSLFKHDRIQTTDTKAKALRSYADHMITLAKRGDLHARRQALSFIREKKIVHKLFEEAKERFGEIPGGYTRIVKIGRRAGDNAPMSIIELLSPEKSKTKIAKKAKKEAEAQPVEAQTSDDSKTDTQQSETQMTEISESETQDAETAETKDAETDGLKTDDAESGGEIEAKKTEPETGDSKEDELEEKTQEDGGGDTETK